MEISTKGATELFASLPSSFHSSYATKNIKAREREKREMSELPSARNICLLSVGPLGYDPNRLKSRNETNLF
jgi:hypothetical protein